MACIIISTQDLRGYGVNRCYGTYTTSIRAVGTRRVGILADQDMGRTRTNAPLPGRPNEVQPAHYSAPANPRYIVLLSQPQLRSKLPDFEVHALYLRSI